MFAAMEQLLLWQQTRTFLFLLTDLLYNFFLIRFLLTCETYLQTTKSISVVMRKLFKILSLCPQNLVFKQKLELGPLPSRVVRTCVGFCETLCPNFTVLGYPKLTHVAIVLSHEFGP